LGQTHPQVASKLSKNVGILTKLKYLVPHKTMVMIYIALYFISYFICFIIALFGHVIVIITIIIIIINLIRTNAA